MAENLENPKSKENMPDQWLTTEETPKLKKSRLINCSQPRKLQK